jgi:hypothetical protein
MKKVKSWIENWLQWVLVSGMSWVVALLLTWIVADILLASLSGISGYLVGLVLGGLFIGLLQWQYFHPAGDKLAVGWLLTSIIGWMACVLGTTWLMGVAGGWITWLVGGLVGGAVMGVLQWLTLSEELKADGRWIVMSATGWLAALGVGLLVSNSQRFAALTNVYQQLGIIGIVGWVIIAITALVILLLVFSKGERHYFNSLFKMW